MGFSEQDPGQNSFEEVKQLFSPEFRNRLDAVVPFHYLETEIILKIVDKNLKQLRKQLSPKNVAISITPSARQWLAKEGYDRVMGARPMERLIEEKLKKPLADELLFGRLSAAGGEVKISVDNGQIQVQVQSRSEMGASSQQPAALTDQD
jgi:ATP-dependent Clp protease ATP-binding subunit ClpA